MMCPDPQILSVYYDKELPSPWNEQVEAHLALCPVCRTKVDQFSACSAGLAACGTGPLPVNTLEAAQERVWQRIAAVRPLQRKPAFWCRTLAVPVPAAAAVVAVFLAIIAFTILGRRTVSPAPTSESLMASGTIDTDIQNIVPVSGRLLQYLGSQDSPDMVIIRLPESTHFKSSGEPAMIRAVDYSGRP